MKNIAYKLIFELWKVFCYMSLERESIFSIFLI